jgi:acetyl esterase/lipase
MADDILAPPPVPADGRVSYGRDPSQFYDVFEPQRQRRGLAVMIHGGFWRAKYDLQHASHICAALAGTGFAVANLEYRRVGNGGGWPATFDDVRAGIAHAANLVGRAPIVLGHSAGGHLALRIASEMPSLTGVVALAPAADLQLCYQLHLSNDAVVEFLGGTPAEKPEAYAAADAARHPATVPRIVLHGNKDDIVALELSRSFIAQRTSDEPRPRLIELDCGHFELIDPRAAAWREVLGAVEGLRNG